MQLKSHYINMTKTQLFSIFFSLVLVVTSCKKEDDDHDHSSTDTTKPAVSISSPAAMQVYNSGDTVRIKGIVTDASLHELLIRIVKDSDQTELFRATPVVHDLTSYTIDTYWKSAVTDHTNASLIISVEDHSSNIGSDTVHIHIMP